MNRLTLASHFGFLGCGLKREFNTFFRNIIPRVSTMTVLNSESSIATFSRSLDRYAYSNDHDWSNLRRMTTDHKRNKVTMFAKDEAVKYISEKLRVQNVEKRLENDRKNLLDEIVTNIQTTTLFQNLRLLQKVPEQRCRPTLEEIKDDFVKGMGGLCYNINMATGYLLKAIGFKSSIALATCVSNVGSYNNHVIVYVEDVEKSGDKFLVETGLGFPTFRAVSLDFEKESPQFADSFLKYKYIKYDGKIMRMHFERDPAKRQTYNSYDEFNFVIDGWKRFYYAEAEAVKNIEELYPHFDKVFTDPAATPFHLSYRVIGFPGKIATMVIDEITLIENEKGELKPTPIKDGDEGIVQTVHRLFPALSEDLARQALASWRKTK